MPKPVTSFSFAGRIYNVGVDVAADDPAVRRHPHLFDGPPPVALVRAPVETATARPGEARAVKRPAKKAAKKRQPKKVDG